MFLTCLQSVHHQKLDDKPLSFSAEVRKHALLKRHVVVPDIQGRGSVILTGKRRHASQAEIQNLIVMPPFYSDRKYTYWMNEINRSYQR